MLKLIRYFKPFAILVVSIVALLLIQAICDLALPDYMSKIVNTGIQQGGIENAAPEVIRQSEWDRVMLFMSADDKALAEKSYTLLEKSKLDAAEYEAEVKDYPALADTPIYKRNTDDADTLAALNKNMGLSIILVDRIESSTPQELLQLMQTMQGGAAADTLSGLQQGGNMPQIKDSDDVFALLQALPEESLDAIHTKIAEGMQNLGESMIAPAASEYIVKEYKAIGMNTDALQSDFILGVGAIMLLISLAGAGASIFVSYLAARVAAGFGRDVRKDLFGKVLRFSSNEIDKFSTCLLYTSDAADE